MQDQLIVKVAVLMSEQSAAYARLESATNQLSAALLRGEPPTIEALTRTGDAELLRMRSRLLEITAALTTFAELRAAQTEKRQLDATAREQFEAAAKNLLEAARKFQKLAVLIKNLALGGSSYSTACIQMCGVPPTTYRAPVLKMAAEGAAR